MVKNEVGLVTRFKNELMEYSHFFHAGMNSAKLRLIQLFLGGVVKDGHGFLVHETLISDLP